MAAGEVLTHGEWLVQRSAGAPEALRTRALRWLAEVPSDVPLDQALARAGESALAGALARGEGRETALDLLGIPYRNGGSDPSGFDCSGLIQWAFARHGQVLPREVRDQFQKGREIDLKDVQPGDLIFFETVSRGASHVGMVIGGGRFVHAPRSGAMVRVESLQTPYWRQRFNGARRLDPPTF